MGPDWPWFCNDVECVLLEFERTISETDVYHNRWFGMSANVLYNVDCSPWGNKGTIINTMSTDTTLYLDQKTKPLDSGELDFLIS